MKKVAIILAVLLAIAAIVLWKFAATERRGYNEDRAPSIESVPAVESPPEGQPPADRAPESVSVAAPEGQLTAAPVTEPVPMEATPTLAPEQALEALRVTFRNYGQRFKGNPVGNNAEITAALNGGNAQGVQFLDPAKDRMNDKGELIDGWGTPYFFHQLSGYEMEIHSAGPDRKMGTADDLVIR